MNTWLNNPVNDNKYASGLVYIAGPYTHPSDVERAARYRALTQYAAVVAETENRPVFSPISHGHPIELEMVTPRGTRWWMAQNAPFLEAMLELRVVQLPGWESSRGTAAEIAYAETRGIPVRYVTYREYLFQVTAHGRFAPTLLVQTQAGM